MPITRRKFGEQTLAGLAGLSLPRFLPATRNPPLATDLLRQPDEVLVETATDRRSLSRGGSGSWTTTGISVRVTEGPSSLHLELESPTVAIKRIALRWSARLDDVKLILGDAWERGYGDLEWRGFVPDRVMPWYFATSDGQRTHAYGVRTDANALCFWQIDPQ